MDLVSKWSLANPGYRILSWTGILLMLYFDFTILSFFNISFLFYWGIVVAVIVMEGMRDYLKIDPKGKAVLITGCDSGFGLHFAEHILNKDFIVFAGVLSLESDGAKYLKELCPERLIVVKLDVTSDSDVQEAVTFIQKTVKERHAVLWTIVNNAGVSRAGPFEFIPTEDYELTYQVNVLGAIRVTKMFLPLMRRSKGRVVNVTSVACIVGSPIGTPYTVSKFAAEGLSQCLRYELQAMDVNVISVEPSYFVKCTNFTQNMNFEERVEESRKQLTEEQSQFYNDKYFSDMLKVKKMFDAHGHSSDALMMEALELSVCTRYPSSKYLAPSFEGVLMYALLYLPDVVSRMFYGGRGHL